MNKTTRKKLYPPLTRVNAFVIEEESPYKSLCVELVRRACRDYENALKENDWYTIFECEAFFNGIWFNTFCNLDPTEIIHDLKFNVLEWFKKNYLKCNFCSNKLFFEILKMNRSMRNKELRKILLDAVRYFNIKGEFDYA